jgi:hypothetical protein
VDVNVDVDLKFVLIYVRVRTVQYVTSTRPCSLSNLIGWLIFEHFLWIAWLVIRYVLYVLYVLSYFAARKILPTLINDAISPPLRISNFVPSSHDMT